MFRRFGWTAVVLTVVGLVAAAVVAASAPGASAYGRANWQTTLHGTFNFPGTGFSFGFWGWCDFAGGVTSGSSADCQLEEYVHQTAGSGWNCHLSIDATQWDQADTGNGNTFHIWGGAVVRPGNLTQAQQDACVGFFVTGDPTASYSGTFLTDVDTFIPAAPGHYNFGVGFIPGAVGSFGFEVNQIP
jgi:hypothetical protein